MFTKAMQGKLEMFINPSKDRRFYKSKYELTLPFKWNTVLPTKLLLGAESYWHIIRTENMCLKSASKYQKKQNLTFKYKIWMQYRL